jgi:hypothetical protein
MAFWQIVAILFVLGLDAVAFAADLPPETPKAPEQKRKNVAPEPPMFVRYTYSLPSGLKDTTEGNGVSGHQLDLGAAIPLYVGKKLIFVVPLKYKLSKILFDDVPGYVGSKIVLHRVEGLVVGVLKPDNKWSITLRAGAIMAGDYQAIDDDTFQPSVTFIATTRLNLDDTLYFGLSLARAFFIFFPIPVLGIVHRPPDSPVWLDIILPGFVRVRFRKDDYLEFVPFVDVKGGAWSVESRNEVPAHQLEKLEIRGGLAIRLNLFGPFWFETEVGGTFYGRYEAVDREGDSLKVLHRYPHLFISGGVILVP